MLSHTKWHPEFYIVHNPGKCQVVLLKDRGLIVIMQDRLCFHLLKFICVFLQGLDAYNQPMLQDHQNLHNQALENTVQYL